MQFKFLSIPTDQLDGFQKALAEDGAENLDDVLTKTDGKVVESAGTGLRTGGESTVIHLDDGTLTLAFVASPSKTLFLSGHFDGKVSCTFDSEVRSGAYKLLFLVDQPHSWHGAGFNVVVAKIDSVKWSESPHVQPPPPPHEDEPPTEGCDDSASPPHEFPPVPSEARVLYENKGDNLEGFKRGLEDTHLRVENGQIVGQNGGGWDKLPVSFKGNIQIDYDVFTDSRDAGAFLIIYDNDVRHGINVVNCPAGTFNGHNIIESISDLRDHQKFYYAFDTLATEVSADFHNGKWVHVKITKVGDKLTDTVGEQVVSADISSAGLESGLHLGLGYYSTSNLGPRGLLKYANFRVVQLGSGR